MPMCPQCGAEYAADAATRTGYCPQCEAQVELPAAGPARAIAVSPAVSFYAITVTKAVIGVNVLVFAAMVLNHVSPTAPRTDELLRWGADFGPLALGGQWWRTLTNVFVHIGIWHLLLNMWALWNLGSLAERLYGRWLYLYIYLFCGVAGSLGSLAWHPMVVGAGASGAIFGVAGALIVTFRWGALPIPRDVVRPILLTLVIFAVLNVLYGAWNQSIDNAAHLGGLSSGVLLGAVVIRRRFRGPGSGRARAAAGIVLVGLLVAIGVVIVRANAWAVHLHLAETAMRQNKTDTAIAELKLVTAAKPNEGYFHLLLARAYVQARQLEPAQAHLLRAAQLSPRSPETWWELSNVYLAQNQPEQAVGALKQVVALAPTSADAVFQLAALDSRLGRLDDAVPLYQRALQLRPVYPPASFGLGATYMRLHDYDNALATFQQLARVAPHSADAQAGIAAAYKAKGMDAEAEAAWQQALKLRTPPQQPTGSPPSR